MSNIYIQEPPTFGKVLLKTSVGDIDIELWSKEAPKACRNFIQLCMEGYYNGTIFHRVVKEFIAQGGDPSGTGEGGESIWGQPFKDEFHSRLRFCRRGLVAMANAGRDDNGSQFFFTLGPTQELQNKHTIFGKVSGETVFNMLKLADGDFDHNDRPEYPQKIMKTTVLNNPFDDIVPRVEEKRKSKNKKDKKTGVKDFKLLSFGEEAEEDEVETSRENKKFSGRSKSTHDILDDPKLSSQPAVEKKVKEDGEEESEEESDLSGDEKEEEIKSSSNLDSIKNKLVGKKSAQSSKSKKKDDDDEPDVEYVLGQDQREERKRKAEALRQEYDALKKSMRKEKEVKVESEGEEESEVLKEYKKEKVQFEEKKKTLPKKGTDREAFTMALLAKFQKKLEKVKESVGSDEEEEMAEQPEEPEVADGDFGKDEGWMGKKLRFEQKQPILAKDASTKDEKPGDWFDLNDPRNPINQRRREGAKSSSKRK